MANQCKRKQSAIKSVSRFLKSQLLKPLVFLVSCTCRLRILGIRMSWVVRIREKESFEVIWRNGHSIWLRLTLNLYMGSGDQMNKEWWLLGCWDRGRSGGPSRGYSTAPCTGTCTQTITLPIIIDGKRHYIPGPRCVLGSKLSGTGLHSGGKSLMEVGWVIRIRSNS